MRPWSSLESGDAEDELAPFDGELRAVDISASGLVIDDAIYVRGCNTRTGPYPYCRHMRHSVYSVTKSMAAALVLLRLAQKYGDDVFAFKIKDYVSVTADHDGWHPVTFGDALNMATGIGDADPQREPPRVASDENKRKMFGWNRAPSAREKLATSFSYGNYPWGPGEVLRYNSTHTFILAAAMDALVKRREGGQIHLWDLIAEEVLRPIGVFHAPLRHTLEPDGGRGLPEMAVGFYPTIEDAAKIASLFQNGGRHDGRQLLHPDRLAEALYRTPVRGLPQGSRRNSVGAKSYHMSLWYEPFRARRGCAVDVAAMSGYGGNLVVLMPNGLTAIRFSDSGSYDFAPMVRTAETIRPLCR